MSFIFALSSKLVEFGSIGLYEPKGGALTEYIDCKLFWYIRLLFIGTPIEYAGGFLTTFFAKVAFSEALGGGNSPKLEGSV